MKDDRFPPLVRPDEGGFHDAEYDWHENPGSIWPTLLCGAAVGLAIWALAVYGLWALLAGWV